ncbi:retron-type reverse transcriptase [Pelotomaculum thermopropionicum SI]|uniref:RNA-directed DNA polymerase n=1 Tax=Pelotomaculum thermopropionicum (strain DSM 13744 / JCM 10971 / SI) TaxID=370438 RepID=A5CZB7_PELTS|nr:retron-type reverse transcriptase [Pelotomaculum thermopropionicum SI]
MKILKIPKKNGKYRTIYAPDAEEKRALRGIVGILNQKCQHVCDPAAVHGFMPLKSPVTNALAHVGRKYTVSFDLEDFFDTVTPEKASKCLTKEQKELVFVDGAARQGLPTSPAVANLAATDMDRAILKWIEKSGKSVVYTRYADDLAFSFDDPELIPVIQKKVPEIIRRSGFRVNTDKTTVQAAVAGRRIICGVAVDDEGVHPTREVKRRLRAAKHQGNELEAAGLEEWCKLKVPSGKRQKARETTEGLDELRKHWKLRKIDMAKAVSRKVIPEKDLGDNCYITNDPAYFMGMSTFTTGWKSCMRMDGGEYRKGVMAWLALPGTSVAVFLSDRTMNIAGVERRRMRARCLVHKLENGQLVYDRLYGNPDDTPVLVKKLEEAGIRPIREFAGKGIYVEGDVPASMAMPYCDNLWEEKINIKSGKRVVRFYV